VSGGYYINKVDDYSGGVAPAPGTGPSAKAAGNNEYVSMVLDYKWTKALDFYAAYMHALNTGGQSAGLLQVSATTANLNANSIYGMGMRYKF
jgi:predicted porin